MTDQAQTARADLAFMKAVVDDRGPLPAIMGAHLLAVGVIYAPNLVWIWAVASGLTPVPQPWMMSLTWLPGTIVWLPTYLWIQRHASREGVGPSALVFASAWGAQGLMTAASVALVLTAQVATGTPYTKLWPALAFVLYGGAWSVVAINRRRAWLWLVALGSFATALVCGALVDSSAIWLGMAAGLVMFFAAPGYTIVRLAPRPDRANA